MKTCLQVLFLKTQHSSLFIHANYWSPWSKKIFQESATGKHRLHEEVKSMLMRCRLPAYGFIKPPSQPALLETSSALPKLLHFICASLEEEIKGPESWSIAGFSALLAISYCSPLDFAVLTAESAEENYAHIFGDSHKHTRLWNKELKTGHAFPVTSSAMGGVNASRTAEQTAPGWDVKTPSGFTSAPLAGPWKSPGTEIHKEQEHVHQIEGLDKSCSTNIT